MHPSRRKSLYREGVGLPARLLEAVGEQGHDGIALRRRTPRHDHVAAAHRRPRARHQRRPGATAVHAETLCKDQDRVAFGPHLAPDRGTRAAIAGQGEAARDDRRFEIALAREPDRTRYRRSCRSGSRPLPAPPARWPGTPWPPIDTSKRLPARPAMPGTPRGAPRGATTSPGPSTCRAAAALRRPGRRMRSHWPCSRHRALAWTPRCGSGCAQGPDPG